MGLNTLPYMHQVLDTPLRMHQELDTYFVGQSTVPFEHWFRLQTPRYHVISTQDAKTWARNAVTGNLMGYGRGPVCVNSAWVLRLQIAKARVLALVLILALSLALALELVLMQVAHTILVLAQTPLHTIKY